MTRRSRIAGIDKKPGTHEFMVPPVRVTKDHHIRSLMEKAQLYPLGECVWVHDMMEEKFAPAQLHHLQVPQLKSWVIGISPNRRHWSNRLQVQNQTGESHIARVQDMIDPLKQVENLRVQMPVGI